MSIRLTITNCSRGAVNARSLKHNLLQTLALLKVRDVEWSITIVNDRDMTVLHEQTMQLATTTDVLTFDLRDAAPKKSVEGSRVELDTVLCRAEAVRRAKELGHTPDTELLLYAIHSLLHVQGYDDLRAKDAARMHRREDSLLIALGVGPVFTPGPRRRPKARSSRLDTRP